MYHSGAAPCHSCQRQFHAIGTAGLLHAAPHCAAARFRRRRPEAEGHEPTTAGLRQSLEQLAVLYPPRESSAPKEKPIDNAAVVAAMQEAAKVEAIERQMRTFGRGCSNALVERRLSNLYAK